MIKTFSVEYFWIHNNDEHEIDTMMVWSDSTENARKEAEHSLNLSGNCYKITAIEEVVKLK